MTRPGLEGIMDCCESSERAGMLARELRAILEWGNLEQKSGASQDIVGQVAREMRRSEIVIELVQLAELPGYEPNSKFFRLPSDSQVDRPVRAAGTRPYNTGSGCASLSPRAVPGFDGFD
jgi:hypothetical protein